MIGTGYVGRVSGVCFSDFGHDVVCVDIDPGKIEMLQAGKVPIFEPGLDALMERNVKAGRLSFSGDLERSVASADAVFIAVGTPTRRGDGHVGRLSPALLARCAHRCHRFGIGRDDQIRSQRVSCDQDYLYQ